ncbi:Bifunctional transcriptional activator/DNA repair enzyme AdaA [compost metagenome]
MWKLDQSEGWFFRFNSIGQVQHIFTDMFELMESFKTANEPRLASLNYELLLYLLTYSEPLTNTNILNNKDLIHKIADHIFDNPAYGWTTESMAELSGYSVYHFIRLFQKIMGIKPNEYVTQCRISAAKNLLLSTESPIYEIAAQIGFAQASYFIRVFKKHTDLSPQAYRNIFRQ